MHADGTKGRIAPVWKPQRLQRGKEGGPILGERDSEGLGGLGSEAGDRIRPL